MLEQRLAEMLGHIRQMNDLQVGSEAKSKSDLEDQERKLKVFVKDEVANVEQLMKSLQQLMTQSYRALSNSLEESVKFDLITLLMICDPLILYLWLTDHFRCWQVARSNKQLIGVASEIAAVRSANGDRVASLHNAVSSIGKKVEQHSEELASRAKLGEVGHLEAILKVWHQRLLVHMRRSSCMTSSVIYLGRLR